MQRSGGENPTGGERTEKGVERPVNKYQRTTREVSPRSSPEPRSYVRGSGKVNVF